MPNTSQVQAPTPALGAHPDTELVAMPRQLSKGHCAIVGLQWGDEGKGKIVDLLSCRFDLVVRYNGGANAGHSVVVGEERYALHLVPSGILYPKTINVLGGGVVIDPQQILKEMGDLEQRGVHIGDNLRISDRAHLVLPYHKLEDALLEASLAKAHGDDHKIGTTGRGIGPCYADKAQRTTAVRVGQLLQPEALSAKIKQVVAIKNVMLAALAQYCGQIFTPIDADALVREYSAYGQRLAPHICDTTMLLHDSMAGGKRVLFEGANATLLDIDHGTYPFVTSSNCSSLGVHTGCGIPGRQLEQVIGIVKAYQTRVGGGPMVTELNGAVGDRIRETGKEYGTTTGRPRRCGWLDLVAVKYSAAISGATGIALMLLDVLSGFDKLKVCVGYRHQGQTLACFPANADLLAKVEPIYEELDGFRQPVDTCRRFDELPPTAAAYVRYIEQYVDVPVTLISVGPRRDQTIVKE